MHWIDSYCTLGFASNYFRLILMFSQLYHLLQVRGQPKDDHSGLFTANIIKYWFVCYQYSIKVFTCSNRYLQQLLLHPFNSLFSKKIWVSRHQKGKPFWILRKQEMMRWQWHQLDHMQIICTSLQTDNHASTSPQQFLQAGCAFCHPTYSIKSLKAPDICNKLTLLEVKQHMSPKVKGHTDIYVVCITYMALDLLTTGDTSTYSTYSKPHEGFCYG